MLIYYSPKDYYLEIYSNIKLGKTYFSITTKEGVEKYVAYREKDVESGVIVKGRLTTIKHIYSIG